jgi:hypothetical protein
MNFDELIDELEEYGTDAVTMNPPQASVNQPSLLTISSANGEIQNTYDGTSYSSFVVNLPRPMLDVKTLQLLSTNIPQANGNIADTACAFWYYRLSGYSGNIPNANNLFMVRLLPSYYKREFITNYANYGYNRTFKSYADLSTELTKSCATDLAWTNYLTATANSVSFPSLRVPFLPADISLTLAINKFQFNGNPTTPVYVLWVTGTTYSTNDVVGYNGICYKALSTQSGNTPSTSPLFWSAVYGREVVAAWNSITTYAAGRYVSYANALYKSNYQTLQCRPDGYIETWSSLQQYYRGSVVMYLGNTYTAINPNLNANPSSSLSWTLLAWTYPYSYRTGMVVTYAGIYYVASTNISTPTSPNLNSAWISVGANFWSPATLPNTTSNVPCYNYLSTGYNDPAVAQAQGTATQSWNTYNLYETGQIVSYNNSYWTNARQSQGETPFSRTGASTYSDVVQYVAGNVVVSGEVYYVAKGSTIGVIPTPAFTNWQQENWTTTFTTPPNIGLSFISKQLDMLDISTYGEISATFYALQVPFGIPPQPYSVVPKRLLNTILGFTWNGQINPPIYSVINQSDTTPLIDAVYAREYNRLRPVPRYSVVGGAYGSAPLLGSSSTTYIYTADGFCNLVYSSIISIYTSIAGASTLDTQRDTNLLATISMNCSTLGVSFWNNFIDNPLTKVQGSIYSVYIELRDEYGDPYPLTNNALSTFIFKVGYKEKG